MRRRRQQTTAAAAAARAAVLNYASNLYIYMNICMHACLCLSKRAALSALSTRARSSVNRAKYMCVVYMQKYSRVVRAMPAPHRLHTQNCRYTYEQCI